MERDGVCRLQYHGCTQAIEEIDHIINVARIGIDRREANDINNLQGVCKRCHRVKTNAESAAARNRWKRKLENHPGLV